MSLISLNAFTGVSKAAKKIPLTYFAREIIQNKRIVFSGKKTRKIYVIIETLRALYYLIRTYFRAYLISRFCPSHISRGFIFAILMAENRKKALIFAKFIIVNLL